MPLQFIAKCRNATDFEKLYAKHLHAILDFKGLGVKEPHYNAAIKVFKEVLENQEIVHERILNEAEYYLGEYELLTDFITDENVERLEAAYQKNIENFSMCAGETHWAKYRLSQTKYYSSPKKEADLEGARKLLEELVEVEMPVYYQSLFLIELAYLRSGEYGEGQIDLEKAQHYAEKALKLEGLSKNAMARALFIRAKVMYIMEESDPKILRAYLEEIAAMERKDAQGLDLLAQFYLAEMDMRGEGVLRPNMKAAEMKLKKILAEKEELPDFVIKRAERALLEISEALI